VNLFMREFCDYSLDAILSGSFTNTIDSSIPSTTTDLEMLQYNTVVKGVIFYLFYNLEFNFCYGTSSASL
jgi:hypothetical protein